MIRTYEVQWYDQFGVSIGIRTGTVSVGDTVRKGYSAFSDIPKILSVMHTVAVENIVILKAEVLHSRESE